MLVDIREERPEDLEAIREVNRLAFAQETEARIVDALRANGAALLSLVAIVNGKVAGHIMYSPATIASLAGAALGPMAVLPELQRSGIGGRLVTSGNLMLRDRGCPFVIVVGHPEYYPRFGFTAAKPLGILCEWELPDDVFMVLALDPSRMAGVRGMARYRPEFAEAVSES